MTTLSRGALRRKRHERIRLQISGSAERPRLSVFRSAKAAGVEAVVLDRGGYQYHGRVRSLAEGAREGGLNL